MARLVVRLLGGFHVELDGEVVYDFETDKARALLAYLVVEADRPHRRETLASLLWPDMPDAVARTNLRLALSRVRRALCDRRGGCDRGGGCEPPFLFVTSSDIQFNTAGDYSLDVAELEAFARPGQDGARQLLPEALCADFLAGFAVPDSEAFQAWVLNKQEHYHRLALDILDIQNAYFESIGEYGQAAAAARLQLQLEPWLEEAHQRCMRDLALAGRREEALQQYEACRRALRSELGLEATRATHTLYEAIRAGKIARDAPKPFATRRCEPRAVAQVGNLRYKAPALVARGDELGQLGVHLDRALAGESAVVIVSGDAGSGKTVLLEALAAHAMARRPDLLVAGARCNPGGSRDACAPLRRLVEMLFGDLGNALAWRLPGPEQVDRLQAATGLALAALAEHGQDLRGTLISAASITRRGGRLVTKVTPTPASAPSLLSQGVLFDQLLGTLAALAGRQPLLLLLDDLHWVDDATAAFLLRLGRELNNSPILVAGAYRSATVALGRRDPRSGEVNRHPLAEAINELRRVKGEILVDLDRADGRAFVEAYVNTEPNRFGAAFRDALYAQTGGHALFTVETLRNLQARGEIYKDEAGRWVARESLDWGALPARVEAAIAERIDRLPQDERRILSVASVQGDDFTAEIAAELAGLPVAVVLASLWGSLARQHHLVKPEGLTPAGAEMPVRSLYRFTHHLFQKYLYGQLDPVERAQLHGRVAACLARPVAGNQAERERLAERLAWHYEAAGLPLQAARALLDAGNQAMHVAAFREALAQYDRGLALLATAPPSLERTQAERLLEVARLGPERVLEGLTGVGVADALARAERAWAPLESEAPQGAAQEWPQLRMLMAQTEYLLGAGELERARAAAERLAEGAAGSGVDELASAGQLYLGIARHALGNARQSDRDLGRMLDSLTHGQRYKLRAATGLDLPSNGLALSALNAWLLGSPETALARSRQAIAAARADGATVGEAAATAFGAGLQFLLRGPEASVGAGGAGSAGPGLAPGEMAELAERCCALCVQQGLQMWRVFAEVMLGRVMVLAGEDSAGIDRIRDAGWRDGVIKIFTDLFTVVLADSCLLAARRRPGAGDAATRRDLLATGLAAIDDKLGPARIPSYQAYEAELHRLRGELLLARDGLAASDEALACVRSALAHGRAMDALALELRGLMSLVRLRQGQGQAYAKELAEARAGLREICARFTEGFDFPDLRDAVALIGSGEETPLRM